MKKVRKKKLGIVAVKPVGDFDPDIEYKLLNEVLYDHDSWYSAHNNNKGNTPSELPDENGVIHWYRGTNGGKHAYTEGETAKAKGNTARNQGNTAQEQGEQAQRRGETAAAMAAYARLMAQNPPRVGKTLPGHEATDNWWYYAVPNEELTDVTYVRSGAWAKGDNLEWDTLTEEEKANIISEILASFATVSEQDAAAVFSDYVFSTTD